MQRAGGHGAGEPPQRTQAGQTQPMAGAVSAGPAAAILSGFKAHRRQFGQITEGARARFLKADWQAVQAFGRKRQSIYKRRIDRVVAEVQASGCLQPGGWPRIKAEYAGLIADAADGDLAETFFNSVHRRITGRGAVSDDQMFVTSSFVAGPPPPPTPLTSEYRRHGSLAALFAHILSQQAPAMPWQNLRRDVRNITRSLAEALPQTKGCGKLCIDVVNALFYRNRGAYLVGRVRSSPNVGRRRETTLPMALPLALDDQGRVYVDTFICDEDDLSIVFSFTRAYFMVATPHPFGLVEFLNALLPNKKRSELFASIGLYKHGKTEFYRDFLRHLDTSDDQFVVAPGIKGMVMTVFSLPSYKTVFKVIRDEFAPQKAVTAAEVRQKYHIVKRHERAGRMADTQEFENLALPLARFSEELLDELQAAAPSAIAIAAGRVRIRHLYTERAMTPLNLHLQNADAAALSSALDEYGNAIKQLAAANIFPGDMLLKNFGVTRHGRVVFYDYDEICHLTDVNFRALPQPRTPEEEMAADPWYSVAINDVFPEEFGRFLFGKPDIKELFQKLHGDLFTPEYWRQMQAAILAGDIMEVYPYRRKRRFSRQLQSVQALDSKTQT